MATEDRRCSVRLRRATPGLSWCAQLYLVFALQGSHCQPPPVCRHTFPQGQTFDLTGLKKPQREKDWFADDRKGNEFYFNVCENANQVPLACQLLYKSVQAPAYQVTKAGDCFWLGRLDGMEWELIDDNEPSAGVELYYFDGEQCPGGAARDVRVQFFCDPDAGAGRPLDYYVLEEDCHYSITADLACARDADHTCIGSWPSQYGCPVSDGGGGWGWLHSLAVLFIVYLGFGTALNMARSGEPLGPDQLPHREFWAMLFGMACEATAGLRAFVEEQVARRKASYERVDGVEYGHEWG